MANRSRGEVTLMIGEEEFILRPTFEAMEQIEDRIGIGIPKLVEVCKSGEFKLRDIVTIIHVGIIAHNDGNQRGVPSRAEIGEKVMDAGLSAVVGQAAMVKFLIHGMAGSRKMEQLEEKREVPNPPGRTAE